MKKLLKYTLVLATLGAISTGCIKEIEPQSSAITLDQVNQSPTAMESMVGAIAAYGNDITWADSCPQLYGYSSMCVIRDIWCNDIAGMPTGYDWYEPFSSNTYMNGIYAHMQIIWLWYTKWLALANDIIRMYPNIEEIPDYFRAYVGCAYAYRAWAWLDMGQMYEYKENKYTSKPEVVGLTIPYLHENITEDQARSNPRLTKAELIGHIKNTLDTALVLLEGFESPSKLQPTTAVVHGLYARLNLWAEDYGAAKASAEAALAAGSYSPLTKEQWTNPSTGFNSISTNSSWMLANTLSSESAVVKGKVYGWGSWMVSENSYGYTSYGAYRLCDARFYSQIPDTDFRKLSWKAPEGSSLSVPYVAAKGAYKGASSLPDLAVVKFRPGQGEPNDYLVSKATDFCMMRMEEMKFIIAECDAREGNSATLVEIVKTRNPEYTCNKVGDELLKEVFFQKRIEFWGEGVMFYDYKRCPDLLQVQRGYEGTNHIEMARFNVDGLAPWMNVCINEYEAMENTALTKTNNPDPTNTVKPWIQ